MDWLYGHRSQDQGRPLQILVLQRCWPFDHRDDDQRRTETHTEELPKYPLRGRLVVNAEAIELRGPGDYYDRKWHLITYRGVPCLLAEQHYREWKRGGELADDRLLFRLPTFDERLPRMNYGGDEKPGGSVTRTSPLPPK